MTDTFRLNQKLKRHHDSPLKCYNCGESYYTSQGQGSPIPSSITGDEKEFCDVACHLSWLKGSLDVFDYTAIYDTVWENLQRAPYVPPPFTELHKFGGQMSIEEYKWGQRPETDPSKRVKLTTDESQ